MWIVFFAVLLLAFSVIPGGISFLVVRWCLERRLKILVILLMVLLMGGTAYGFLRLTGLLLFAGDHRSSFLFWGSTWRDSGIKWLYICLAFLMGGLAAFVEEKKRQPQGIGKNEKGEQA